MPAPDIESAPAARRSVGYRGAVRWAGLMFAIVCGAFWDAYPLPDAGARLQRLPKSAREFNSCDVALTDQERLVLGKAGLVHRDCVWKGKEFLLTVIDGTRDRHAVHDPRYCFEGAGWQILEERPLRLPGGEARWFKMARADQRAEAAFWFSDGTERFSSLPEYWWRTTLRRLTLGRRGAEPLMVTVQAYGADQPDWPEFLPQAAGFFGL